MMYRTFSRLVAAALVVALVAPAAFFAAPPQRVFAASGVSCIGGLLGGALSSAKDAAASAVGMDAAVPVADKEDRQSNASTAGTVQASCINDLILVPLARAAIRVLLMQMTASVVSFITGKSNGNGSAQFVTNVQGNIQNVGDAQAFSFLSRFSKNSNSPFAASITSSLRTNYLQQSSLAGYFAQNKDTLPQYSSNPDKYLSGDWSKGGIGAWFALTTQDNNNPYTKYQAAESAMNSLKGGAVEARKQELNWGQGFLSWCGVSSSAEATQTSATEAYQACMQRGDPQDTCNALFESTGGTIRGSSSGATGDSCTNSDGTPGTVMTPSSVIHDFTQKAVVNTGFDSLISANDLDNSLGVIVGALLSQALGSVTGLLGGSSGTASRPALTTQFQTYKPTSVNASQTSFQSADTVISKIAAYTSAWGAIRGAATAASTSVAHLASVCTAAAAGSYDTSSVDVSALVTASRAQAQAAQTALGTVIAPIIARATAEINSVADTQAFAAKVQAEAIAPTTASSSAQLAADIAALAAMPPSSVQVSNAQSSATLTNNAIASPTGSLTVSRGTLFDQMNLMSANAKTLEISACSPSAFPATPATRGGGSDG